MSVTIGLMRHAPTQWNLERRIQGQADSPLTSVGLAVSRRWGRLLRDGGWDRIVTSDLGRALATTAGICETISAPVIREPRLREQDWGLWTGRTLTDIRTKSSDILARIEAAGWEFRPPGGESRAEVWQRARRALREAARRWSNERLLVVTHEGVLKCLLYGLAGRQFSHAEPRWKLGSQLHLIRIVHDIMGIDSVNALSLERVLGS